MHVLNTQTWNGSGHGANCTYGGYQPPYVDDAISILWKDK